MNAPWLIFLTVKQSKAITPIFIKPNQYVMIFLLQNFFMRGDAVCTENSNIQGNTQQYAVAE